MDDLKRGAEDMADDAKHEWNKATRDLDNKGRDAGDAVKDTADDAGYNARHGKREGQDRVDDAGDRMDEANNDLTRR